MRAHLMIGGIGVAVLGVSVPGERSARSRRAVRSAAGTRTNSRATQEAGNWKRGWGLRLRARTAA